MTQLELLAKYLVDQSILLSRNTWLLPFITLHLARRLNGFQPHAYVVSYPKSGRTWLRMVLMSYYSKAQRLDDINWSVLEEFNGRAVVFNHADGSWRPTPKKIGQMQISSKFLSRKILLLVRDPRAVLVSNWHHLRFRYKIYPGSLSDFIREGLLGIDKIIGFMNLWVDQKAEIKELLIVKYEDLVVDTEREIRKVLDFLGETEIDSLQLEDAIRLTSFHELKNSESRGLHNPFAIPINPNDERTFKFRRGTVWDWEKHINRTDLAYVNKKILKNLRDEFGYAHAIRDPQGARVGDSRRETPRDLMAIHQEVSDRSTALQKQEV